MKKFYTLFILVVIAILFSFSTKTKQLYHKPNFSGGKTGNSMIGCGGMFCHSNGASNTVAVNLIGLPPNPIIGTPYDFTITVTGNNPRAGFDLTASSGTLDVGILNDGAQLINNELTHTAPKPLNNGIVSWSIRWTPTVPGITTFSFAANNVNFNFGPDAGDLWNIGTANSNMIVLPVQLSSFKAQNDKNEVKLSWIVEQEINFKQYVVEKSCDGITFSPIATIPATESNIEKEYNYIDKTINCNNDKNFYRLRMDDKDASFEYSSIVNVTHQVQGSISVFPNPVSKNSSIVKLNVGKTVPESIQLFSNNGSLLSTNKKLVAFENQIILPATIKPGNYYFKVNYKNNSEIVRFVVN